MFLLCLKTIYRVSEMGNTVVEWRTAEVEETELTQPEEDCQYQEMILSVFMGKKMRASVFFQMVWMGVVSLKFYLNSFVLGV
jgi:hypothetical protein